MKFEKKILMIAGIILAAAVVFAGISFVSKDLDKTPSSPPDSEAENQPIQKQESGRYFLSKVDLIENRWTPALIKCLFDEGGNEIYQGWSAIYYPPHPPYDAALVKVKFQDKEIFLDKTCFISEIKSEEEWQEVEIKYNFLKEKFGK